MCIFTFGPCSSLSNSFFMLLIHSTCLLCSLGYHISPKLFFFFPSGFWYHLPLLIGRIFFRCFGTSCFVCIVLSILAISLIFVLSPVIFGLFPRVLLSFFLVLFFPFRPKMFQCIFFVSSFLPVFVDFLSLFLFEFPIQVLIFYSRSIREPQFFYKIVSIQHRLVHLIR